MAAFLRFGEIEYTMVCIKYILISVVSYMSRFIDNSVESEPVNTSRSADFLQTTFWNAFQDGVMTFPYYQSFVRGTTGGFPSQRASNAGFREYMGGVCAFSLIKSIGWGCKWLPDPMLILITDTSLGHKWLVGQVDYIFENGSILKVWRNRVHYGMHQIYIDISGVIYEPFHW